LRTYQDLLFNPARNGFDLPTFSGQQDWAAGFVAAHNLLRWSTGWGVLSDIKVESDG